MNQKLSDWASIAEIASGVAVVVTLVLLIAGIRENTDVTRVTIYSDLINSVNELELEALRDAELNAMLLQVVEGEESSLTQEEFRRVVRYAHIMFRNYEKAYFSRQYGVISESEWSRFERMICVNFRIATAAEVPDLSQVLTNDFYTYLESSCQDSHQ